MMASEIHVFSFNRILAAKGFWNIATQYPTMIFPWELGGELIKTDRILRAL